MVSIKVEQEVVCALSNGGRQVIYTTRSVVCLFMTPIIQWKRLDSVTVECTCFATHRPALTLQLHNFDCSGLVVLHCCVAIGKISTDTTHRAVPPR